MTVLVTGAAGFIGYHLSKRLLEEGHVVIGIDNINDYYSPDLKFARLEELGISRVDAERNENPCPSKVYTHFVFYRVDISNSKALSSVFKKHRFDKVCHLAAQAGVRYSIENPSTYIQSNIVGFGNILEAVRHTNTGHLIYASSSSVYGESKKVPFSTDQQVDYPISLYAATKKANELMAHTYSHLYKFHTTGLRFFTVYGPFGRPDMAYYSFTNAIIKNKEIKVFNKGRMQRDFTYVSDIVEGIMLILHKSNIKREKYKIYNIGNGSPESLESFIELLETYLDKKSTRINLPMQPGDVTRTFADVSDLCKDYGYTSKVTLQEGLRHFVEWYIKFHNKIDNK